MKTLLYLLPLCSLLHFTQPSHSPAPEAPANNIKRNFFRFGDQLVTFEQQGRAGAGHYLLLSLHNDEQDAIEVMKAFSKRQDAYFIGLQNKERRLIEGDFLDKKITFDPNHVFTHWGRKEHLKENGCWNKMVDLKVEQFAQFILNELPHDKTIVSLHTHAAQALKDYADKKSMRKQAKSIHVNKVLSADDYFVTTDEAIFSRLQGADQNVVLLHPKKMENDGALAVYCARTKRPYVHIQSKEGHGEAQEKMLSLLHAVLK